MQIEEGTRSERTVRVELHRDEVEILARVAHYYERSMGITRHVLRLTGGDEIKAKYRFIVDEANSLDMVVLGARSHLTSAEGSTVAVPLTVRALVAFWGRLLSSLNIPRSRRKLRRGEAEARRALADKLYRSIKMLHGEMPHLVEQEIATRRAREVEWMRGRLAAKDV